ncbi:hypothetical protein [Streptomyces sp. NPDC026673]|uniref:hypothetical protein n=1 Tax=Streptomyces sp. NPDC026673 TaxID=3155724 RepID=UPI0033CFF1C4
MREPALRHARLATVAAVSLLLAGCSATTGSPAAAPPHPAPPSAAAPAATATDAAPSRGLAVRAAPTNLPTAVARAGGSGRAERAALKVTSYDRATRRAVISAPKAPETGDVIASGPAPGAPDGLLARVTRVLDDDGTKTRVETAPATMSALLGDDRAAGTVPVDPAAVDVEPLVADVDVSWATAGGLTTGPRAARLPLGSLRIDVGAAAGVPAAGMKVSGFVQVAPEVEFSYDGGSALSPDAAFLGLSGKWTSGWAVRGRAAVAPGGGKPLRVPFARLHADPVLQVGPVPVVVNLDLTCYLQVEADGTVSVDVRQDLEGGFRLGGDYTRAAGWRPVTAADMTSSPVRASLTADGRVKAAVGAEASVGLYGAVGVTADLGPYLRGEATAAAASRGGTGSAGLAWRLYGGVDLTGALQLRLSVFGTPAFEQRIPLGALHREWPLAEGAV